jgi:hypothetical protein
MQENGTGMQVARRRQLDDGGEHTFGPESGIDALQLQKAAQQETGARQQHEGERNFRDYQRAKHAVKPASAAEAAAFTKVIAGETR